VKGKVISNMRGIPLPESRHKGGKGGSNNLLQPVYKGVKKEEGVPVLGRKERRKDSSGKGKSQTLQNEGLDKVMKEGKALKKTVLNKEGGEIGQSEGEVA